MAQSRSFAITSPSNWNLRPRTQGTEPTTEPPSNKKLLENNTLH